MDETGHGGMGERGMVNARLREALFRVDPLVLGGCIVSSVFVTSVAMMSFEFGSRVGGWSYPYYRAVPWRAIVPFAAAAGCARLLGVA